MNVFFDLCFGDSVTRARTDEPKRKNQQQEKKDQQKKKEDQQNEKKE
jgi:hypothetical protein